MLAYRRNQTSACILPSQALPDDWKKISCGKNCTYFRLILKTQPIHKLKMASHIGDLSTLFQRSIPYLKQDVFQFSISAIGKCTKVDTS